MAHATALRTLLTQPPALSNQVGDPVLPLQIGIWDALLALLRPGAEPDALARALRAYTRSTGYFLACARKDAMRIPGWAGGRGGQRGAPHGSPESRSGAATPAQRATSDSRARVLDLVGLAPRSRATLAGGRVPWQNCPILRGWHGILRDAVLKGPCLGRRLSHCGNFWDSSTSHPATAGRCRGRSCGRPSRSTPRAPPSRGASPAAPPRSRP